MLRDGMRNRSLEIDRKNSNSLPPVSNKFIENSPIKYNNNGYHNSWKKTPIDQYLPQKWNRMEKYGGQNMCERNQINPEVSVTIFPSVNIRQDNRFQRNSLGEQSPKIRSIKDERIKKFHQRYHMGNPRGNPQLKSQPNTHQNLNSPQNQIHQKLFQNSISRVLPNRRAHTSESQQDYIFNKQLKPYDIITGHLNLNHNKNNHRQFPKFTLENKLIESGYYQPL